MPAEQPELATVAGAMESLGCNCEFGLVQRRAGVEPLGLLRFANAPLHALVGALQDRFTAIGTEMDFSVDSTDEWIGLWRGFTFHSTRHSRNTTEHEVRDQEARRLPWLAAKLVADLESAEKLFVYTNCDFACPDQAEPLREAICGIGTARLLVVMADQGRAGSVERLENGLLVGYVRRLTPAHYAAEYDWPSWEHLLPRAYTTWKGR